MATLKITYEAPAQKWFANIRAIYRSKWVVFDKDGNGIYNKQDEFANGFVQLNSSAGINLNNGFRIQAGAENLWDRYWLPPHLLRPIWLYFLIKHSPWL